MQVVTLTNDWHKNDYYTAAVTGRLLSGCENVQVVTLSNQIKPYSLSDTAFILRNSYTSFPKGTVHMVCVGSDPSPESPLLAAEYDGHYFLTSDNGLLGLLGDKKVERCVELSQEGLNSYSFPALHTYVPAACSILSGTPLEEIGKLTSEYKMQVPMRATLEDNTITGAVLYSDSYGNAITNITRELFERIGKSRNFVIYVQSKHYRITKLNLHYSETAAGDLLAIFNSIDLLEIAIRNGSARDLLNLNTDSTIRVEFNT